MTNDCSGVAEKLAEFIVKLRDSPSSVPADVTEQATQRLLDNLGCISFGRTVKPARAIAELAATMGAGDCRQIGSRRRTSPTAAAFAHGTLAQSFELNDLGVYTHPGACVIPACLAGLDTADRAISGAEFVAAIVAGYEVTIRLAECVGPAPELDIGWHTPPFHGAVGAAASAAMLLGLDQAGVAQALVIAADLAGGGLMLARLGSDIKRVHCGRGAETGVLAALMAQNGLRSRLDTFEHPDWGYCRTMTASANGFDLNKILCGLGEEIVAFRRTAVKYYPVGAEVIGAIDSVSQLKRQHRITPADIERLEIGTPSFFVKAQGHEFPERDAQIHFNIEYGAAMALFHDVRPVHEDPGILRYWLQGYKQSAIKALAARIHHVVDPVREKQNPYGIDSTVKITLRNGTLLENKTGYIDQADSAGTMQFAAMSEDNIVRKFRSLLHEILPSSGQDLLIASVLGIAGALDARSLWDAFGNLEIGA